MDSPNTDQLIEQMRQDELSDQEFMTPVQYSKIRPISSPQIYQLARNKKIALHLCQCGRKVLDVKEADKFFSERRPDWPVQPET